MGEAALTVACHSAGNVTAVATSSIDADSTAEVGAACLQRICPSRRSEVVRDPLLSVRVLSAAGRAAPNGSSAEHCSGEHFRELRFEELRFKELRSVRALGESGTHVIAAAIAKTRDGTPAESSGADVEGLRSNQTQSEAIKGNQRLSSERRGEEVRVSAQQGRAEK